MTLESTVPLPSLGRFHSSAPHNVTPDTVQRKRSTYMERREIKDTCFLTRHPHIFQTSIGLGRGTATQGGMMMKNQLVVISSVWKYPECRHELDGTGAKLLYFMAPVQASKKMLNRTHC